MIRTNLSETQNDQENRPTVFPALLLVQLFGGIAGCNTIQGAGKDIEGAGKAIKDGAMEVKKKL